MADPAALCAAYPVSVRQFLQRFTERFCVRRVLEGQTACQFAGLKGLIRIPRKKTKDFLLQRFDGFLRMRDVVTSARYIQNAILYNKWTPLDGGRCSRRSKVPDRRSISRMRFRQASDPVILLIGN